MGKSAYQRGNLPAAPGSRVNVLYLLEDKERGGVSF